MSFRFLRALAALATGAAIGCTHAATAVAPPGELLPPLGEVRIHGLSPDLQQRIRRYFEALDTGAPVPQGALERAVMLASDLAGVSVTSQLEFRDGRMDVTLHGVALRQRGSAMLESIPLPGGDATRALFVQEGYSLLAGGDLARLLLVGTRERATGGSWVGAAFYRAPIGSNGAYIEAYGGNALSRQTLGERRPRVDLRGRNITLVLGHPVQRTVDSFTYLIADIDHQRSETQIVGVNLRSRSNAIRAHLLGGKDWGGQALWRWDITLSAGRGGDLTPRSGALDEESFAHLRLEGAYLFGLDDQQATTLRLEAHAQWTPHRVPEVERFAMGYAPFLRGYAPAEVEGDRGASFTAELARSFEHDGPVLRSTVPFAFFSAGRVSQRDRTEQGWTLASAGLGADIYLGDRTMVSAWVGLPLRDGPLTESRNPGVYASIMTGW